MSQLVSQLGAKFMLSFFSACFMGKSILPPSKKQRYQTGNSNVFCSALIGETLFGNEYNSSCYHQGYPTMMDYRYPVVFGKSLISKLQETKVDQSQMALSNPSQSRSSMWSDNQQSKEKATISAPKKKQKMYTPIHLSEEGECFFEDLRRKGEKVTLHYVISYQNKKQWDGDFEKFVRWLNQNTDVVSAVTIVDTAYLNRINNNKYSAYIKTKKNPTPWRLRNEKYLALLDKKITWQIKGWAEYLLMNKGQDFKAVNTETKQEYKEDKSFRDIVEEEIRTRTGDRGDNVRSILEECGQYRLMARERLDNQPAIVILYPGREISPIEYYRKKHKLPIIRFFYNIPVSRAVFAKMKGMAIAPSLPSLQNLFFNNGQAQAERAGKQKSTISIFICFQFNCDEDEARTALKYIRQTMSELSATLAVSVQEFSIPSSTLKGVLKPLPA